MTIQEAKLLAKITELMAENQYDEAAKELKKLISVTQTSDAILIYISEIGMANHPILTNT